VINAIKKPIQNRGARWVCGSRYNCHSHTWSKSSSAWCCEFHWPSLSTHLTIVTIYDMFHCHIILWNDVPHDAFSVPPSDMSHISFYAITRVSIVYYFVLCTSLCIVCCDLYLVFCRIDSCLLYSPYPLWLNK